ncbi:TPA: hypothetical protein ACH3X1_006386 [Trebouxia sp. C0004]
MARRTIAGLFLVMCLFCISPAHAFIEKCPADGAQAQECVEDRIDGLLKWSSSGGIYAPRLQAGHVDGMRGMIATKTIKKGGLMMSIPREMALIVQDGTASPFPWLLSDEDWSLAQQEVQLAALLLYHAKLGQESKWYPWIQALPTTFDTLPHWTAAELDELQLGTTTTELGFRSEVDARAEFSGSLYNHFKGTSFMSSLNVTQEEQDWALSIVFSRSVAVPRPVNWAQPVLTTLTLLVGAAVFAFSPLKKSQHSKTMLNLTGIALLFTLGPWVYWFLINGASQPGGEDDTALLPLFDMLNHDARQEGSWLKSSWTGSHFQVVAAAEGFAPGKEATISYGQKPNEAFLLHYGFVDTTYKADFYSTDLLEHVQQQYNIPEDRVVGLAQAEKLYKAVESMSLKKGGAADEVPKALRYLLATSKELKEVEEQSQTTGQWLADILEYRRLPTPMTPFDYITLSDSTELKVQEASLQTA